MLQATFIKHELKFNEAGGTSRGVLHTKPSWYIKVVTEQGKFGIGECSIIPNLSIDDTANLEEKISEVCLNINAYAKHYHTSLLNFPALRFALEVALTGLEQNDPFTLFPSDFTDGTQPIVINGLIWMGTIDEMLTRIEQKLNDGFSCLKLKIGAIDFQAELNLLKHIRNRFSPQDLELRVDANGAFAPVEAMRNLEALSAYHIHSIEQPIKAGQIAEMHGLCRNAPLPIALDEELIGVNTLEAKKQLLSDIQPQYIILKPSLLGGWQASEEWINVAEPIGVKWWATSALEANVGLNAIAQWVFTLGNPLKQGLGTGQVFSNNTASGLYLKGDKLCFNTKAVWQNPFESRING